MTARIFIKLILAVTGVLTVALIFVNLIATPRVRASLEASLQRELTEKARALEFALPREQSAFSTLAAAAGGRLTWIAPDGRVLGDSEGDPASMENHATRPEVAQAMKGQTGTSLRPSVTIGIEFLYVAVPIKIPMPGSVLRIAVPSAEVNQRVGELRNTVLLATALAFLPAVLLAAYFARYFSNRLGAIIDFTRSLTQGNFHARLEGGGFELGLLASNLNETGEKLQFIMTRLEAEHAELEKVERIRKDFVINVSHGLRTPLASIQGYTETLLDGAIHEPENNVKFLNIIRQNTERLTRLTADLLVLSRIELGQQKFKFASQSVSRLLTENADSILPLARRKGIALNLEAAPPDAEVFADAEAVHQILTNLLENAIKYTPDGGSVFVGARPLDGGDYIEFYVRDTGLGIPPEDLSRLFERFYRVDKARSKALGGTGLGLAIVKHLTLVHAGEVRVESKVDKGSTFYFTLPVHDLGLDELGVVQHAEIVT